MENWKNNTLTLITLLLLGLFIGLIAGVTDFIFGSVLLKITAFRTEHIVWLLPFLAPIGLFIVWLYKRWGNQASRGMGLVFDVGNGHDEAIPKRLSPLIILTTWMTHLFGGSAGREGVAIQIGAGIANWTERKLLFIKVKDQQRIFIVTGMAAGFAGLFETPFAALFFSLEVLVAGSLVYTALLPALVAALTASSVSYHLGLEKFSVALHTEITWNISTIIKLILLGIAFGLTGNLFTRLLVWSKKQFATLLPNPFWRIGLIGLLLSVLFFVFFTGRYSGLGTNLIASSFNGGTIYSYDWILKLILTILTLSVGFQGGEVTPLFSIGATLGVFLATLLGFPIELAAALGYASVFGSATNTLLAPIFIGAEVFGFNNLPYFIIVCVIAYTCNQDQSIYGGQKKITLDSK